MKGLLPLFFGLFATFAFSWVGLALIPNSQIGHLDPQMDEEGADVYPAPISGMAVRGRHVYTANGCFYCHTQQVRADYAASDIDRKWGDRRSAPRDYVFERPALLGKSRMGPDLSNIGKRAPVEEGDTSASPAPAAAAAAPAGSSPAAAQAAASPAAGKSPAAAAVAASPAASAAPSPAATPANGAPATYSIAWHHQHLYAPRSFNFDSNMPAYQFLYEKRRISGERSAEALNLTGADAPPEGWEVVPTYDAQCLVAYLMSRDQSHPLNELKSAGAPAAAPAAAAAPAPTPAVAPAK